MLAACALTVAVAACSSSEPDRLLSDLPVEALYNQGMDNLAAGNYNAATVAFDEVERQHPFSIWAPRAQLMSAYAHFQNDSYDDAVIALDRFIELHPSHQNAPYAYYLRAITHYEQIVDVARDQAVTRKALDSLEDVIRRYPGTDYARDARLKRDLAVNHLAGKEMSIGRFYLRQGKLVSAMNRFTHVLVNYQTTAHAPEALHRLVEGYMVLGMMDEARKYAAVLGHNFPSSEWYSDSYALLTGERVEVGTLADDKGFISDSVDYLFTPNHTIGMVDPHAEVQGTGIEVPAQAASLSGGVTRAEILNEEQRRAALRNPSAVSSTVAEISPEAGQQALGGNPQNVDSLLASAREQRAAAEKAAAGWEELASNPELAQDARPRAEAEAQTAAAAARYWGAREDLLEVALQERDGESVSAGRRADAETAVAEAGVAYWRTVAQHGASETERQQAAQNAQDAEQALAFWRESGRSWLGRLLASSR